MRVGSRALSLVIVIVGAAAIFACSSSSEAPASSSTKPASTGTNTPPTDAGATDAADDSSGQFAPPPPPCTTIDYSDWSACHFLGTQTRTVVSSAPPGCYATGLVLKQSCTFTPPSDGPGLYDAYCSDCHGNSKKGKSASAIQSAINNNTGGMSVLSSLTPEQIALIAAAP